MLSLSLAKLSTAQDADSETSKLNWSHNTQDLFMVIDTFGARGPISQLLKVVQSTQVLHVIEIERLINDGNDLIRTMQEHGVELKVEQLPISALVRCPLLAIRWQLPNKKVRRVQLKFRTTEDYDTAYNHLHQLGLRMSSVNHNQNRQAAPPQPHISVTSVPSPSTPQTNHVVAPSCPPSRLTELSNRPYTAVTAPTTLESRLQQDSHSRPFSAYTGSFSNQTGVVPNVSKNPLHPPEYFVRPDSASSTSIGYHAAPLTFPPRDPSTEAMEPAPHANDRPETALLFNRPGTSEAILPPRRELPFARSSLPRSSGSDRPSSRPSTGVMGPPPLPARVASLRPSSSRATGQLNELPALPKPTLVDVTQQQPSWMQRPPRTPNMDQATSPGASSSIIEGKENRPLSGSSPSPLTYKRASSSALLPTQPVSVNDATQKRRRTESQSPLSTPPTSDIHNYRAAPGKSPANPTTQVNEDLAAYAMQSNEGRRAALNEFIFKCLGDDNFLTLLEDMETCYARVGLGMR